MPGPGASITCGLTAGGGTDRPTVLRGPAATSMSPAIGSNAAALENHFLVVDFINMKALSPPNYTNSRAKISIMLKVKKRLPKSNHSLVSLR